MKNLISLLDRDSESACYISIKGRAHTRGILLIQHYIYDTLTSAEVDSGLQLVVEGHNDQI